MSSTFCRRWLALVTILALAPNLGQLHAAEPATYAEDVKFLKQHTTVLELTAGEARVAICPDYQGRVMTSTAGGDGGSSYGWINRAFIAAGQPDKVFNNYGGEDRFWLGPEAGQFAFFFASQTDQTLANWITPPALNEKPFKVTSAAGDPFVRVTRHLDLNNWSSTRFSFDVTRNIRLLLAPQFASVFGAAAGEHLAASGAAMVGFETDNTLTNRSEPLKAAGGLASIWTLGQFKPGPNTWIIVPYKSGDTADLGPIVDSSYFFDPPAERLKILPSAILFKADAQFRSKIGVNRRRVRPVLGAVDFDAGTLTIVSFSMPPDPAAHRYVNNLWHMPQAEPYVGDVANSYNDGPPEPGAETLGGFFELETLSPAVELASGQSLRHVHRTFHIQFGGPEINAHVNTLAAVIFGLGLDDVRKATGASNETSEPNATP